MSWCETVCKNVPLCNKLKSLSYEDKELIRRERRDGGEGEERGLRNRDREKRDKKLTISRGG